MNTNEIKQQITMPELLRRYGIEIRNNMCSCPFHGQDRHPSAKVFNDGLNCFTCGWNGDVFKFVMDYEKVDFKTAFKMLGGTYKAHQTKASKVLSNRKFQAQKSALNRVKKGREELKKEVSFCLDLVLGTIKVYEPENMDEMSEIYVNAQNDLPIISNIFDEIIEGKEVDTNYAFRKCAEFRQKYLAI